MLRRGRQRRSLGIGFGGERLRYGNGNDAGGRGTLSERVAWRAGVENGGEPRGGLPKRGGPGDALSLGNGPAVSSLPPPPHP